jgi:flagellar motor switch protein FliG
MLAVEFETQVENGIIKIPEKYRDVVEGDLKIIILKEEKKSKIPGKQKMANIKRLLKQIQEKNIFQNIENPAAWQKAIRDEWT